VLPITKVMRRLMMTAFGFNDSGGGTTVPRLAAKELARRGWDVSVFHAAVNPIAGGRPYELAEWSEDGVRLIGVHNRPHGLFDLGHPHRELDDPPISAAFAGALDRLRPDVVHFHNLHNLGASLLDHAGARGLPAYFSTHNYWLICPRAYLLDASGAICPGPGDGSRCASCTGSRDVGAHQRRLAEIRARARRNLTAVLTVSHAVRHALLGAGYPAAMLDVVRQAMPHESAIWSEVGAQRRPGRAGAPLTVAFLGSAYPHKGPQLLVAAAQQTQAEVNVKILGEVQERFARGLRELDRRGVVQISGAFDPSQIGALLADVDAVVLPSMWWDCAPLAAAESLAARTPLVVPRLGGLPEAIRDGIDGLTFDALDAGSLTVALDRLAQEPGLLERLQRGIGPPRAFSAYIDELEAYYAGERPGAVSHSRHPPAVRWQGEHGQPNSLSIINDRVTERLPGPLQRVHRDGLSSEAPLPHPADIEVRHQWPPDLSVPASGRLVILAPWEFGSIPRSWLDGLAGADEIWVPSEYVRGMYLDAGLPGDKVAVIPNGVDLETFAPAPAGERESGGPLRFLFVGGLVGRKGPDILLEAWCRAFAGREDVELVVKDFGAGGIYRDGLRQPIRAWAAAGHLPRVTLLDAELEREALADLYRSCDVFVAPYRGEGFCMPVLEAMACGLPVIATGGGPTDEFCPPQAGWRIASQRAWLPTARVGNLDTVGRPWVLEPSVADLAALMQEAASHPEQRRARGVEGRLAAESLSWEHVARRYAERLAALAASTEPLARLVPREAFALTEDVAFAVLAEPAWRGADLLGELLSAWSAATNRETSACLYLLADPAVDGSPAELEAHVLTAAARTGANLETCADINVLMEPMAGDRDARIHAAMNAYVQLGHPYAGRQELARSAGNRLLSLATGQTGISLPEWLADTLRQPARAA
jgi:glycosyltransferase involved in cell wall biosynthesis